MSGSGGDVQAVRRRRAAVARGAETGAAEPNVRSWSAMSSPPAPSLRSISPSSFLICLMALLTTAAVVVRSWRSVADVRLTAGAARRSHSRGEGGIATASLLQCARVYAHQFTSFLRRAGSPQLGDQEIEGVAADRRVHHSSVRQPWSGQTVTRRASMASG